MKNTLSGRLSFFDYPNACYDQGSIVQNKDYKNLEEKGRCAIAAIRENMGEGRLFLSKKAIQAVDKLFYECARLDDFVSYEEHLSELFPVVKKTYNEVLKAAKRDLKKSHYANFAKSLKK